MACLDTCVLLDLFGRGGAARRRSAEVLLKRLVGAGETLSISRFTEAEFWVGIARSSQPEREQARVEDVLADLLMLEFDAAAARLFGEVTAHLQSRGTPAGDMDVLIASVAIANQQSLVTRNPRHFAGIPQLAVVTY
jgi:tRNA(fMet)-specific endonuclease VapC